MSYLNVGVYFDFSAPWFSDIGFQIFRVMILFAFLPLIGFSFMALTTFVRKRIDKRGICFCCCKCCCKLCSPKHKPTRQTTIFGFKALHSGNEFEIHYKYAHMLTITWVTFLYGPGMPILFPIAFVGMCVLYVTDRIAMAYWNKKPPSYDSQMNDVTIRLLKIAPIMYVSYGAWLYSNQQAFSNKLK